MRLAVLILNDVIDVGLASILDAFETANSLGDAAREGSPFEVELIGLKRHIVTHQGLKLKVGAARESKAFDVLVIPALAARTPEALAVALKRQDVQQAAAFAWECHARGIVVATACTGTFLLAEAGLLEGRSATTTWWLAPMFRKRYPHVQLDDARMVVSSGKVLTAGAALAHLDLALFIIRQHRPALGSLVARYMVVEPHHSQAIFAITDQLAHEDPIVERFEQWARQHFGKTFSLSAAARGASTSERTLARRTQVVLGKSPLEYVQKLRVERTLHQIRCTTASIGQIASEVGYENGNTLRTLIRRQTGSSVRHIRSVFRTL